MPPSLFEGQLLLHYAIILTMNVIEKNVKQDYISFSFASAKNYLGTLRV